MSVSRVATKRSFRSRVIRASTHSGVDSQSLSLYYYDYFHGSFVHVSLSSLRYAVDSAAAVAASASSPHVPHLDFRPPRSISN